MTLHIVSVRKVVVVGWDTEQIKGADVSLQAGDEEKRTAKNDGEANLYFPMDFTGAVEVTVKGSKEGEDTTTLSIP